MKLTSKEERVLSTLIKTSRKMIENSIEENNELKRMIEINNKFIKDTETSIKEAAEILLRQ